MLSTPATPDNLSKRRKLFAGAALSQVRRLALPSRVPLPGFWLAELCARVKRVHRPTSLLAAAGYTGDLPSRHIATHASRRAVPQGLLVAPLVRVALAVHPGVLFTAFGATACEWWESLAAVAPGLAAAQAALRLLAVATAQYQLAVLPIHRILPAPATSVPAGVFACFSAAALLSPRRSYLYLGGLLSSVLTTFMW